MNSALYLCSLMHNRMEPKPHRFHYKVFMFWLDLDEIDSIAKKFWLISRNRFNMFNFRDSDHLQLPADKPDRTKNTKQQITDYLLSQNVKLQNPKIFLLTNLRTLGHQFNPVSFYYIYENEQPICCVAEIGNTFGEMKLFLLGNETLQKNLFLYRTKKYFYVSPYIEHDVEFDFQLALPTDKLNLRIDDYKDGRRFFIATLTGVKKKLTQFQLIWYAIRFPFITVKVITLIHWQAMLLWLKKIPYQKKADNANLQRDVLRKYPQS
ncbi:MAG TPA: DUF1365 domain-containing protein [Bacteroidia bacterium]|nr:DUF1365 domain-containing protein [Bacteroidia bacterium]